MQAFHLSPEPSRVTEALTVLPTRKATFRMQFESLSFIGLRVLSEHRCEHFLLRKLLIYNCSWSASARPLGWNCLQLQTAPINRACPGSISPNQGRLANTPCLELAESPEPSFDDSGLSFCRNFGGHLTRYQVGPARDTSKTRIPPKTVRSLT